MLFQKIVVNWGIIKNLKTMLLLEMKSALEKILKTNLIDWLSEDEKNLIVLEAEKLNVNNTEDLAGFLFLNSKVFKSSLE